MKTTAPIVFGIAFFLGVLCVAMTGCDGDSQRSTPSLRSSPSSDSAACMSTSAWKTSSGSPIEASTLERTVITSLSLMSSLSGASLSVSRFRQQVYT